MFDGTTNMPPALSIEKNGPGHLAAAWAGFTTAYVLESKGDLRQANSWQAVAASPVNGGGWTTVALAATNSSRFYRLRWNPSATQF